MFGIVYQILLILVPYTLSSFKRSLHDVNFNYCYYHEIVHIVHKNIKN